MEQLSLRIGEDNVENNATKDHETMIMLLLHSITAFSSSMFRYMLLQID